ncbi:6155_t:CDS:2, partial [Gigaspora rosea]
HDGRINFDDFKKGRKVLKLIDLSEAELKAEFDKIDMNHGGLILFDEILLGSIVMIDASFMAPTPDYVDH